MTTRVLKDKTCKQCNASYTPSRPLQSVCGFDCAISQSKAKRQAIEHKAAQKATREARERIKSKADWRREAQQSVNLYIRTRDKGKPCISCDKPDDGSHQRHASHYRSVGACSQLRYNTYNIHASCAQCNTMKSGNAVEYRIRLVKLIGPERVEWLEGQNWLTQYSVEYLQRIKRIFNARARHIKRLRGIQ